MPGRVGATRGEASEVADSGSAAQGHDDTTWLGLGDIDQRIKNHLDVCALLREQGKTAEAAELDERFNERPNIRPFVELAATAELAVLLVPARRSMTAATSSRRDRRRVSTAETFTSDRGHGRFRNEPLNHADLTANGSRAREPEAVSATEGKRPSGG